MRVSNYGVSQFIVYADDPDRAAAFYRAVFGWETSPLGPPPGLVINNPGSRRVLRGHLALRTASESIHGFECVVSVASLTKTAAAVLANGGTVLQHVPFIRSVGGQLRFRDPEGNVVQAFQFPRNRTTGRRATSNKRMQLTRSARANGRRGPRS